MSSNVVFGITRRGHSGLTLLPKYFDSVTTNSEKSFPFLLFCHTAFSGGGIDETVDVNVVSDAKWTGDLVEISIQGTSTKKKKAMLDYVFRV